MASRNQVINKWVNRYPTGLRHRVEGFGGTGERPSPVTLSYNETGKTCHNLRGGAITFNLPANADPGVHFRFVTASDNAITVDPPDDDVIIINDGVGSAGASIASAGAENQSITVEYIGKTAAGVRTWIAYSEEGTWS